MSELSSQQAEALGLPPGGPSASNELDPHEAQALGLPPGGPQEEPGILSKIATWATTPFAHAQPMVDERAKILAANQGGALLGKGSSDAIAALGTLLQGSPGFQPDSVSPTQRNRLDRFAGENPGTATALGVVGGAGMPMLPGASPARAAAAVPNYAAPALTTSSTMPVSIASAAPAATAPAAAPGLMSRIFDPKVVAGAAGVAMAGHPEAALTGFAGHAALQVGKQYGPGMLKATVSGFDKLTAIARTNPQALGRFGPILSGALKEGPQSFAARSYALAQTDPSYQQMVQKLAENE